MTPQQPVDQISQINNQILYLKELEKEKTKPKVNRRKYQSSHTDIMLNSERLKAFPIISFIYQEYPFSTVLFNQVLEY